MPDFIVSIDLGQTTDPTALAVLKRSMLLKDGVPVRSNKGGILSRFTISHLQRFPLGTSYTSIVASTIKILSAPQLRPWSPRLAVDATGVGRAVMDMFLQELIRPLEDEQPVLPLDDLYPITITAGEKWSAHQYAPGVRGFHVPKVELASTVQATLGSGRLGFANLADKAALEQAKVELKAFKVKITRLANQTFAAREGSHDDIVLAIACGMWLGSLPRINHRGATAYYDARLQPDTEEALKAAVATGNPDVIALVAEHDAEQTAMAAEARRRDEENQKAWLNLMNPAFFGR